MHLCPPDSNWWIAIYIFGGLDEEEAGFDIFSSVRSIASLMVLIAGECTLTAELKRRREKRKKITLAKRIHV